MAMTTETVWAALDALLDYAKNCGLLHPLDETFARNTLLSELRLESYEKQEQRFDFPECLNLLCDYAAQQGMIADTIAERDLFDTKLMGFLTPRPSEVVREFRSRYTQSPKAATDYFYTLSQRLQLHPPRPHREGRALDGGDQIREAGNLHQPVQARERPPGHRGGEAEKGVRLPQVSALPRKRGLCGNHVPPGAAEPAGHAGNGERPALGLPVFALRLL